MSGCRRPLGLAACALAVALSGPGCQPSADDIVRWKGTEKGPGKLRDVLKDDGADPTLRAQAAAALIQIGQGAEAVEMLRHLPQPAQKGVLERLLPSLVQALSAGPGDAAGRSSPAFAAAAKDALFRLRDLAAPGARQTLDAALVGWITADLSGRLSTGAVGAEQIITALGAPAQGPLVEVLARSPAGSPDLLPAAALLGRVGDAPARARGAARLIDLVRPVLQGPDDGGRAAEPLLQAIGLLGGDDATAFLLELAQREAAPRELRKKALLSLAQTGAPAALPVGLRLAGDRRQPPGVREAAFDYLEKAGAVALPGLRRLVADPGDPSPTGEITRFRALEAAVSVGGTDAAALRATVEALPPGRDYAREDLLAYVAQRLTPLGTAGLPGLRGLLQSPSWVARAAAALALGEVGEAEDIAALEALGSDGTRLRGKDWNGVTLAALGHDQAQKLRSKR